MNVEPRDTEHRTLLARALLKLEELESQLAEAERAKSEPIAIIGLACRLPMGANDPEAAWRMLHEGVNAVTEVPPDRWDVEEFYDPRPGVVGKTPTRAAGFLDAVDMFDPQFFGISPREAFSMDPQQRLLLEVAWEALERAGIAPPSLGGSRTGVFVGMAANDHLMLHARAERAVRRPEGGEDEGDDASAYFATGSQHSVASGRLAYVLGLHGPCMSVDTACSAALLAVHLGCQSLRLRESSLALVGGVNVLLDPSTTLALSNARMLAPDCRCKTFDAAADGYARAEACVVMVLKRLSAAQADGDNILAVIRGSAVNQDGRSNGLTAPNRLAQEALLRDALTNAKVQPADIQYVEAHGTGTPLGDPIEVEALATVLGEGRPAERPLLIGSIKTNVGHAEPAAGIVALLKVVLALEHEEIPAHLHFRDPNPHIPWDRLPVEVTATARPWPRGHGRRLAGVSSFGYSGTNVHVIVEEAPEPPPATQAIVPDVPPAEQLLVLSARSAPALAQLAGRFEQHLATNPDLALRDVCATMCRGRAHFNHRLAVLVETLGEAQAALHDAAAGRASSRGTRGQVETGRKPDIAFLFTGQGAQFVGMGRQLYATEPTFRRILDHCDEMLAPMLDRRLLSVLYPADGDDSPLDQTAYAQPGLFALEYALAELWRSWGIEPTFVMGHSLGEYVAACVAGVFSLEDGLRLAAARGRLMQALPRDGAMIAVLADPVRVEAAAAAYADRVAIAAINGPSSVVVSGARDAVEAIANKLRTEGIQAKALNVSHAFHSPLMDPILAVFERVVRAVEFKQPNLVLISNVTGTSVSTEVTDPAYWVRHVRQPVRFADGVRALADHGVRVFVEVGPQPVLLGLAQQCVERSEDAWLASLRRGRGDRRQMLESLAALYLRGAAIDWAGHDREQRRPRLVLPTYPFQRQRYRLDDETHALVTSPAAARAAGLPMVPDGRLLGRRLETPLAEVVFESRVAANAPAWLRDHQFLGMIVFPATAYLEMAFAAAREVCGSGQHALADVAISEAMVLLENESRVVQVALAPGDDGHAFRIFSRPSGNDTAAQWTLHVSGRIVADDGSAATPVAAIDASLEERFPREFAAKEWYAWLPQAGTQYSDSFQRLRSIRVGTDEAIGEVSPEPAPTPDTEKLCFHPGLLDAALQLVGATVTKPDTEESDDFAYMVTGMESVRLLGAPAVAAWAYGRLTAPLSQDSVTFSGDACLLDGTGQPILALRGVRSRRARREVLASAGRTPLRNWTYEVVWQSSARAADAPQGAGIDGLRLEIPVRGVLDDLTLQPIVRQPPGPDEVEVAVQASGLNFRDVLNALGMYPGEAGLLGNEFAGTVVATGSAVTHLEPGDPVMGLAAGTFGNWVTAPASQVVPIDSGIAPEDAATLPIAFATALYCLVHLAGLHRGDRVLIHAAAGGVGLAAVQIAQRMGAEVFATVGSAEKREVLMARGVRHIGDSRSLKFAEQLRAATGGEGVDVVLNSLSGDFIPASLALLRPGGRFVEIGKRGIWDAEQVRATRPDVGYHVFFLGELQMQAPALVTTLLEEIAAGVADGSLRPLPRRVFPLEQAADAFRFMAQARHIGKIVLVPATSAAEVTDMAAGTWIVFAEGGGMGQRLAQRLIKSGGRALVVQPGNGQASGAPGLAFVDPERPEDYQRLFQTLHGEGARCRGVVHLWGMEAPDPADLASLERRVDTTCRSMLYLTQALANVPAPDRPRLWLATRGAQPVRAADRVAVGQAATWGLARVIAAEHPDLRPIRIDVDPAAAADDLNALLAELVSPDGEDQIAFRDGVRHVARLARPPYATARSRGGATRAPFHRDATYLITGGLGGLGLTLAAAMVRHGARNLVLVGRSTPSSSAEAMIEALRAEGAVVLVAQADVARRDELMGVLTRVRETMPELRGVMHAAGVLDDGPLLHLEWSRFARVMAPKVAGTWNLHELTRDLPLDFLVLFSSAAALLGSAGQGNYAAANAFLDGFAHHRRALGLPALAINWGPWSDVGMAAALAARDPRLQFAAGLGAITPALGEQVLMDLLDRNPIQVAVLPVTWSTFLQQFPPEEIPLFYSGVAAAAARAAAGPDASGPSPQDLARLLDAADEAGRRELVRKHVRGRVAAILRLEGEVDEAEPLARLGLDSLVAVALRNRLERDLSVTLPVNAIMEGVSARDVVEMVLAGLGTRRHKEPGVAAPPTEPPHAAGEGSARSQGIPKEEVASLTG